MAWLIIVGFGILLVVIGISAANKQKENNAKLTELGYSLDAKVDIGKYVAGHPDINDAIPKTSIFPKDNKLEIMLETPMAMPVKKGEIENQFIKNILAEDLSTVEKRVTVGRLLMTGIFAFALKKKKKNELAYLTIEWNDGRFDHETIFEFEGAGAMQNANTARNKIIKIVR
ncbi:MAG TPA: hypothetical protein VMW01_12125 [Williamwhitmania sp.]|nr:hypothetical protein [Williamwhitmania sp.]